MIRRWWRQRRWCSARTTLSSTLSKYTKCCVDLVILLNCYCCWGSLIDWLWTMKCLKLGISNASLSLSVCFTCQFQSQAENFYACVICFLKVVQLFYNSASFFCLYDFALNMQFFVCLFVLFCLVFLFNQTAEDTRKKNTHQIRKNKMTFVWKCFNNYYCCFGCF